MVNLIGSNWVNEGEGKMVSGTGWETGVRNEKKRELPKTPSFTHIYPI